MCKRNIVLIGMPGAGKSTIGVLLAKALKMPFTDTDLIIQEARDMYLQEIINNYGIEMFLSIEEETVLSIKLSNYVIATGGSVVYSERAMEHFKKMNSLFVYLKVGIEQLSARLENILSRGVAKKPGQSLVELYNEREPLYEKYAGLTIDCTHKTMEEIVDEIIKKAGIRD
jgi:shikimate kinase